MLVVSTVPFLRLKRNPVHYLLAHFSSAQANDYVSEGFSAVIGTMDTIHRLHSQRDKVAQAIHRGPLATNSSLDAFVENANLTVETLAALKKPPRRPLPKILEAVTRPTHIGHT